MTYTIHVPGDPMGKQRARVTRFGTFTPTKTVNYEEHVRNCLMEQIDGALPKFAAAVPLLLEADFCLLRPVSARKGKKRREHPTTKPDLGNCLKIIEDALNKRLYDDDSQIVQVACAKRYTENPREVGVIVAVSEVTP